MADLKEQEIKNKIDIYIQELIKEMKQADEEVFLIDGVFLEVNEEKSRKDYYYYFELNKRVKLLEKDSIYFFTDDHQKIMGEIVDANENSVILYLTNYQLVDLSQLTVFKDSMSTEKKLIEHLKNMNIGKDTIPFHLLNNEQNHINNTERFLGQDAVFNKSIKDRITFIWGPPGTGKTEILSRIATEFIKNNLRVLLVSYSNTSVDEAVIRIKMNAERYELDYYGKVVRTGNPQKEELLPNKMHYDLMDEGICLKEQKELHEKLNKLVRQKDRLDKHKSLSIEQKNEKLKLIKGISNLKKEIRNKKINLIGNASLIATTVVKTIVNPVILSKPYDVVILDEASMVRIPDVVFLSSIGKQKFIGLGDFKQLPAIVKESKSLRQDIFNYVKIEEAVKEENKNHEWLGILNEQRRMHPDIADFISKKFYKDIIESDLNSKKLIRLQEFNNKDSILTNRPLALMDYAMISEKEQSFGSSRYNILSALISALLAKNYNKERIKNDEGISDGVSVGIATPYNAHASLLSCILEDLGMDEKSAIASTVHRFQGGEKDIIIYDSVEAKSGKIGYMLRNSEDDYCNKLFNVAMTRSRAKFIMVSDVTHLMKPDLPKDTLLKQYMTYCYEKEFRINTEDILRLLYSFNVSNLKFLPFNSNSNDLFLRDIENAKEEIVFLVPNDILFDEHETMNLVSLMLEKDNINIQVLSKNSKYLDSRLKIYQKQNDTINSFIVMIDEETIWLNPPIFKNKYKAIVRFVGRETAVCIKTFNRIKKLKLKKDIEPAISKEIVSISEKTKKKKKEFIKEEPITIKKETTIDKKEVIRQARKCANRFRYEEALQKLETLEQDLQVMQLRSEIIRKMNR